MKKPMTIVTAAFALTLAAGACKDKEPAPAAAPAPATSVAQSATQSPAQQRDPKAEIERGKYLVTTSACHDCHTPLKMGPNGPEPDMSRALSGHPASMPLPPPPALPEGPWVVTVAATNTAWSGPWGVSYTANLTPDPETGTGNWSRENFIDTIRNGRHMGVGRELLPPMPWQVYGNMTDEDLGAIYAYLRTVPAISNKVPAPVAPKHAAAGAPPGAAKL